VGTLLVGTSLVGTSLVGTSLVGTLLVGTSLVGRLGWLVGGLGRFVGTSLEGGLDGSVGTSLLDTSLGGTLLCSHSFGLLQEPHRQRQRQGKKLLLQPFFL